MGEIIPGVDPREKMTGDYRTKGVHFETVTKWQPVCFFLLRAVLVKGAHNYSSFFLCINRCIHDLLNLCLNFENYISLYTTLQSPLPDAKMSYFSTLHQTKGDVQALFRGNNVTMRLVVCTSCI